MSDDPKADVSFADEVATAYYKGRLFGSIDVLEHAGGDFEPVVLECATPGRGMVSGGRYSTRAEAFAAFGAALDASAAANRERRYLVAALDAEGESVEIIERGLSHEAALALRERLATEGERYAVQPDA